MAYRFKLGDWGSELHLGFYEHEIELVRTNNTTNTTTMNLKEKFTLAFKSEPFKSFRQKGITNGDDMLTSEGQQIFLAWLLQKNGDAFKTEVVDKIEADKQ